MRYIIQYYDKNKENQISVMDFGLELFKTLPILKQEFGEDFVFIYTDTETKLELFNLGFDTSRIFTPEPSDNKSHTMRWLSIMAQFTLPFQISPVGIILKKHDVEYIEVKYISLLPFNQILDKYGIQQTGGFVGGDIMNIPNYSMSKDAYIEARDIVNKILDNADNNISEYEIQVIFGSIMYKYSKNYNIEIKIYND